METEKPESQNQQRFTQTVNRVRSELDRLVDMAWTRGEEVWGQFRQSEFTGDWSPSMDIVETEDSLILFVNLPGIAADRVEITLVGNTLELTAQAESLTLQPADRVHKRERPTGRLHRVITLPVSVDSESAIAHSELGVLKVEMKKSPDKRSHKVPVVSAETVSVTPM